MDDRKAAKMIRKAKEQSVREQKEPKRRENLDARGQEFCSACYAEKTDDVCPHCTLGRVVYHKFCRRCLTVHISTHTTCTPWRPEA